MKRLEIISVDWDSTLADTSHRHHMIDRSKENNADFWDRYALECDKDTPGPAYPLARYFTDNEVPWIIVSGRAEIARAKGNEWLRKLKLYPWAVYLCDDRHDYMPHGQWKTTRLLEIQEQLNVDIVLHIDDLKEVKVYNEKFGIPTMLVHGLATPVVDHLG